MAIVIRLYKEIIFTYLLVFVFFSTKLITSDLIEGEGVKPVQEEDYSYRGVDLKVVWSKDTHERGRDRSRSEQARDQEQSRAVIKSKKYLCVDDPF
ncbi:hypothetical protein DFA_06206 [Cavenderia fasciculata]|uniref:Uncharacterized protein n=1 Tax=Cavenderia fasciculata TaxID=261658 RepID=F4PKE4_CACFS|nr:uncharacterized protein DFA_06206 [Cavenderia fasciculata]EGG24068.1 hypothetical protein DFA_06206 [Cavenderia fasciculata]|eukprot:XP_004361919.1 hypothetical protein DFA_06206 [Cavenderia fasciculata]